MNSRGLSLVYILLALFFSLAGVYMSGGAASAEISAPDWVNGQLKFEIDSDYKFDASDRDDLFPNIPEQMVEGKTNQGTSILNQKLVASSAFMHPTSGGYFEKYTALPIDTDRWQKIKPGIFADAVVYPNPATNGFLAQMYYHSYGNSERQVRYIDDWRTVFGKYSADKLGNITRTLTDGFDVTSYPVLKNPDGTNKQAITRPLQAAYSKNGRWAVFHVGQDEVVASIPDLKYTVLAKFQPDYYPMLRAVSNSGRFVSTGSVSGATRVYDSKQCSDVYAGDCKTSIDISKYIRDEYLKTLGGLQPAFDKFSLRGIKFVSESKLELYFEIAIKGKTSEHYRFYVSTDPGQQTTRYLAMGDSFSSGEGAGDYYEATNFYADENNYNVCHQSRQAYSELLNKLIAPDWYDSIACSGAMMKDVDYESVDVYYYKNASQAKFPIPEGDKTYTDNYLESNLRVRALSVAPGYVPQNSILMSELPSMATISVGGNDIGFGSVVTSCIWKGECYSNRDDRERLADNIASKIPYLTKTYEAILRNMSGEDKKLYVIGYPQLVNENTTCGSFMSGNERVFANNLVDYLNAAIKISAENAGARFITTRDAFVDYDTGKDYRLCGKDSSPAINGFSFDIENSSDGQPLDKYFAESYHPNKLGNALLAKRINLYTNDLQLEMPKKSTAVRMPDMDIYERLVGDKEDNVILVGSIDESLTDKAIVVSGDKIQTNYSNSILGVPINGQAKVTMYSDPVVLGYITPSSDGSLSGDFVIPKGTEPGIHEIRMTYIDMAGENHEIYKHIMVISSYDDYDGDGVKNDDEICAVGGLMDIDLDGDGIDDACDSDVSAVVNQEASVAESNIPRLVTVDKQVANMGNEDVAKSEKLIENSPEGMDTGIGTDLDSQVSGQSDPSTLEDQDSSKTDGRSLHRILVLAGATVLLSGLVVYLSVRHKHLGT